MMLNQSCQRTCTFTLELPQNGHKNFCTGCIDAAPHLPPLESLLRVERPILGIDRPLPAIDRPDSISISRVQLPPIQISKPQSDLPDGTSLQYKNREQMSWSPDASLLSVELSWNSGKILYPFQAMNVEEKDPSDNSQRPQAVPRMGPFSVDPSHDFETEMSVLWADLPLEGILHHCFQRNFHRPMSIPEPVSSNPDELTCARHVEAYRVGGISTNCRRCLVRRKDWKTRKHTQAEVERRAWHKFFLLWLHKLVPDQILRECGWDETPRSPTRMNLTEAIPTKLILLKASVLYIRKLIDAINLLKEKLDQLEMTTQTTVDNEVNAKDYMLFASPPEKCNPVCYFTPGNVATGGQANYRPGVAPTPFQGVKRIPPHLGNLETSAFQSITPTLTWPVSRVDSVPTSSTEGRRTGIGESIPPTSPSLKRRRIGNEGMRLQGPRTTLP